MTDLITEVARHIYDTYAEFADCDLPAWDDLASTFKEPSIAAAERVVPLIEAETRRKVAEELKALRYCCGPDDIQCMGCDAIDDAATAIARGGNEQTREET